jgi:hypothetical protein
MPIGNRGIVDVLTEEEYINRTNTTPMAQEVIKSDYGIEKEGCVYPIIPTHSSSNLVGVKIYDTYLKYQKPQTEEDKKLYSSERIMDFENNPNGVRGMIESAAKLDAAERTMLLTKDNITQFIIKEDDSPEFALIKQAINRKNIDMSSYKQRHGGDYSNNMRLLNTANNISFSKFRNIAEVCDMEAELVIRDKPGCANPIGEELRCSIT